MKKGYIPGDTIAIVGAGMSGISFANALIENGVSPDRIHIYEKSKMPASKIQTEYIDGKPFDLGALLLVPGHYDNLINLFNKFGITLRAAANSNIGIFKKNDFGVYDKIEKDPKLFDKIKNELVVYAKQLRGLNVDDPLFYVNVPDELNIPWNEFLIKNELFAIKEALTYFVDICGYSHPFDNVNTQQMVKTFSPKNIINQLMYGVKFVENGWDKFLIKFSESIEKSGVEIFRGFPVESINRRNGDIFINNKILYDHVVYTADLSRLNEILLDKTKIESDLFSRVKTCDYRTLLFRVSGYLVDGHEGLIGFYENFFTPKVGQMLFCYKHFKDSDVVIAYVYGQNGIEIETIVDNMLNNFAEIGISVTEFIKEIKWNYFPHVEDNFKDFFRGIVQNQGNGGLWVTGEATSFAITLDVYEQANFFAKCLVKNEVL